MRALAACLLWPAWLLASPAPLRWAADSEGGAPFAFQDPADPSRLIGCEVELMEELCRRLGRPCRFVQNTWEGLIPGLFRGDYDVAVNAIEITPDRAEVVAFSEPYYITYEQLAVREDNYDIQGLGDLQGRTVATYKGALAQRILEAQGGMDIRLYEAVEPAYRDLLHGRVEAVLLDHPLALYYGKPLRGVKLVGPPIARMEYGMALRPSDTALLRRINAALQAMRREGRLREIFGRWNLWTPVMADWSADPREPPPPTAWRAYLKARGLERDGWARLRDYARYLPLLGKGAWVTLQLSVLGMALALVWGLALTLARLQGPWPLRVLALAYVEIFRGSPLLIQLFILFYGLPLAGIRLPPFAAAVLGLGLNYAAYESEVLRAALLSVPKGQREAALALGFSGSQTLRHVVLPQALRVALPPLTNDFIVLLKDSSLVSVITMVELTKVYSQLAAATYDWLGLGLLTAGMYFLVGLPFVALARRLEKKFTPETQRPPAHH